jgi:hypothetical protein
MVIAARFASRCPNCRRQIEIGAQVNWSRGATASHVTCPEATLEERAASVVTAAVRTENLADCTGLLTAIVNGDEPGNAVVSQAALDIIEDRLFSEYELTKGYVAGSKVTDQYGNLREVPILAPAGGQILKGIYRVSLTGSERRYGVDCVNLSLIPNEKYGSIKVGEWQGESIGRVNRDGSFSFWPSFEDRTATRTYALLAALDIVRGSADPVQFAKAYAAESQTCWRCGADLVDEQSRARLLGPTCFRAVNKGA